MNTFICKDFFLYVHLPFKNPGHGGTRQALYALVLYANVVYYMYICNTLNKYIHRCYEDTKAKNLQENICSFFSNK